MNDTLTSFVRVHMFSGAPGVDGEVCFKEKGSATFAESSEKENARVWTIDVTLQRVSKLIEY
jgi:hypothetical protein